jgi:hypothetical protein
MPPDNTPKPRQPLTRKRRAAIKAYCHYRVQKTLHGNISHIVDYAIYAERMDAEKLYAHLSHNGWHWHERLGTWSKNPPTPPPHKETQP